MLVVIGFNQTTYSVREDTGSVTVSVSVISGTISQDVIITLSTVPGGSATGIYIYIYIYMCVCVCVCRATLQKYLVKLLQVYGYWNFRVH